MATPRRIELYQDDRGNVPYLNWVKGLRSRETRNRIIRRVDRLEQGNLGDHKGVGEGVIELRLHWGPGYRVYLGEDGARLVVLLCGGDKSTQATDHHAGEAVLERLQAENAMSSPPSIPYKPWLREHLSDPREALAYLEIAMEEYEQDGDQAAFLLALRNVADAQGGLGTLAERTGLNRENLYRALSRKGNPRLDTVGRILHGLGFRLALRRADASAASPA